LAVPKLCEAEPPLADAFKVFSAAARSLEHSYFKLSEEVQRLRSELERERELRIRREALAQMAALIAHEVRNPLGSVELFVALLGSSSLAEEQRQWVVQIQAGLRILSASVNNVLEFHSPCSRELALVELAALLNSLRELLHPAAAQEGMELIIEIAEQPLLLRADQQELLQAFLNISLNAIRFAAHGGTLKISAVRQENEAVLRFEDYGPGIPAELRTKIFEPGFTTRSGGPGLGMAVAKKIVERHGGVIELASTGEKGTTFQIRLPLTNTP
jgi:signal transduction histidine kinase